MAVSPKTNRNRPRLAVTAAESAGPAAPILLRGDLARAAAEAKGMGYDALEVHVPDIWNFDAGSLAKACAAEGVGVSFLVSGQLFVRMGLSLSDDDPAIVHKAVEGLKLFADAAAVVNGGVVVGWVRGRVGERSGELLARQGAALREVGRYAGGLGVPVCLEAINRYELDSLNRAADVIDFIRAHDIPNTFVHLDTFHMNIEEYSAEKAIRQCGPLLGYLHLAENTRWYPGHDRTDFSEVFAALDAVGYAGYVAVECLPYPDGAEAAKRACRYLRHRYLF
ncbi:MAG: sugar phosphate isomerase/epimerase [Planctomycetota bacterium]|jgi:sugar phosphate isomerase/epimerase|nr:sugar phosphate isomerase/epimerase [Planctomycetota bacterium]